MANDVLKKYKVGDRYLVGNSAHTHRGKIGYLTGIDPKNGYIRFQGLDGTFTDPYIKKHFTLILDIKPLYKIY